MKDKETKLKRITHSELKKVDFEKKQKLIIAVNSDITNITVTADEIVEYVTKADKVVKCLSVDGNLIMFSDKWVRQTETGNWNFGIKHNYDYNIVGTDSKVRGNDLKNFILGERAHRKIKEEKAKTKKQDTKPTTKKASAKKEKSTTE